MVDYLVDEEHPVGFEFGLPFFWVPHEKFNVVIKVELY